VDVSTGAAVADNDTVSTVVPPSSTKDEGAYVGVSVAFEGVCIGGRRCFVDCCLPPPQLSSFLIELLDNVGQGLVFESNK
jgi:hypothetical protein